MTRKEIKSFSKEKLKGRWTNFFLLFLIVWLVQGVITYLVSNIGNIQLSAILNIGNNLLLAPFLESLGVVYVIKLVDRDDKVGINESLPSFKVWINFVKKLLALILFELPAGVIATIASVMALVSIISNHFYEFLLMNSIIYDDIINEFTWIFIVIMIAMLIYNIIVYLFFFPVKYLIVDEKELGIWEAVGKAFKMMKGHKWELFVLVLSCFGWIILALLPMVIGFLIVFYLGLSIYILPIFALPALGLSVYLSTIYRVYYLSISDRALEIGKDQLNRDIEISEEDFDIK